MQEVTVSIGGKEYIITPLAIRPSREWRQELDGKFDGVVQALQMAATTEMSDVGGMGAFLSIAKKAVIGSLDEVLNLVCAYAPEINQDRERIENEGHDAEIVEAFGAILALAFPLGKVLSGVSGLMGSTTLKS